VEDAAFDVLEVVDAAFEVLEETVDAAFEVLVLVELEAAFVVEVLEDPVLLPQVIGLGPTKR